MQAVAKVSHGEGGVALIEAPEPVVVPGHVLIEVAAAGICGTDLHILQGEFAPKLPIVPGHEFAGEVVGVGSQVTEVSLGDQVAVDPSLYCHECRYCRTGHNNLCERWAAIGVTTRRPPLTSTTGTASRVKGTMKVRPLPGAISRMSPAPWSLREALQRNRPSIITIRRHILNPPPVRNPATASSGAPPAVIQ